MRDKGAYSLAIIRTFKHNTKIEGYGLYIKGINKPYRSKRLVHVFGDISDIQASYDCMDHSMKMGRLTGNWSEMFFSVCKVY